MQGIRHGTSRGSLDISSLLRLFRVQVVGLFYTVGKAH